MARLCQHCIHFYSWGRTCRINSGRNFPWATGSISEPFVCIGFYCGYSLIKKAYSFIVLFTISSVASKNVLAQLGNLCAIHRCTNQTKLNQWSVHLMLKLRARLHKDGLTHCLTVQSDRVEKVAKNATCALWCLVWAATADVPTWLMSATLVA